MTFSKENVDQVISVVENVLDELLSESQIKKLRVDDTVSVDQVIFVLKNVLDQETKELMLYLYKIRHINACCTMSKLKLSLII